MKFLEEKLEALDAYFAPKKESEKWMIILGVAGIITYLAYELLLPYTKSMYKSADMSLKRIEKSIAENRKYLNDITVRGDRDFYIKDYTKKIALTKKKIENTQKKIDFIEMNLNKLSDMLFNQQNWAIFLNSITDKAKLQNIDIDYVRNSYVDSNGSFGHVLEVGIGCRGTYKNIVKFMNELEQSVLVTDIYGSELKMDTNTSQIVADINISVWGINR